VLYALRGPSFLQPLLYRFFCEHLSYNWGLVRDRIGLDLLQRTTRAHEEYGDHDAYSTYDADDESVTINDAVDQKREDEKKLVVFKTRYAKNDEIASESTTQRKNLEDE